MPIFDNGSSESMPRAIGKRREGEPIFTSTEEVTLKGPGWFGLFGLGVIGIAEAAVQAGKDFVVNRGKGKRNTPG